MGLLAWVKLPTTWVGDGLPRFRWSQESGADNIAGLMLLIALAHHADQTTGFGQRTYDQLHLATGLSRAKISAGLSVLEQLSLVAHGAVGRSSFQLLDFDPRQGWGKLPARRLYDGNGRIVFFHELSLRNRIELDALKLYILITARRDNGLNMALMNYETIQRYTGIERNRIRRAISLLIANNLVHIDRLLTDQDFGLASMYRLVQLETTQHMGTTGRRLTEVLGA